MYIYVKEIHIYVPYSIHILFYITLFSLNNEMIKNILFVKNIYKSNHARKDLQSLQVNRHCATCNLCRPIH